MINGKPYISPVNLIHSSEGKLSVIEGGDLSFDMARCYFFSSDCGIQRGNHANKKNSQFMVCFTGKVEVTLSRGDFEEKFFLDSPVKGLFIPAGYWRTVDIKCDNSICFVVADKPYSKSDYIYDKEQYNSWVKNTE